MADFKAIRDDKLRRRILVTLNLARGFAPSGALSGTRLMGEASVDLEPDMGFESEWHFLQLVRDLVNHGLVAERDLGTRRRGEAFAPRHISLSVTARGTQLVEEKIPPVAGVDDERIAAE